MAGNVIERLIIEIGGDARKFKQELKSLQKANKQGEKSFQKLALVGKAGFLAVAAAAAAVTTASTKAFVAFEKGVTNVAKTTNLAGQELEDFKKEIMDLSEEIPVTTDKLLEIATAAGQLGIKGTDNLAIFTETIAKLGATTDLEGEAAAIGIARILNLVGEGVDTVDRFGSTIVDLGNSFETSESQILEISTEVAKATVNFKLSSPEVLGLATAMSSLGIEAEAGSTVVGKAFMKIDEVIRKQAGPQFETLIELTGMTGEELTQTFQTDAIKVFESFIDGLKKSGKSGKAMRDELHKLGLSGIRVEKILPTLAERSDKLSKSLNRAGKAAKENSALNKEAASAFATSSAKLLKAQNKINNVLIEMGAEIAPAFVEAIEGITDAVRKNSGIISNFGKIVGLSLKAIIFIIIEFGKIVDGFVNKFKIAGEIISGIVFFWIGAFLGIAKVTKSVFDFIISKVTEFVDIYKSKLTPIKRFIQEKIIDVFNVLRETATQIFDDIVKKSGEFTDLLRSKTKPIQQVVSNIISIFLALSAATTQIFEAIGNKITQFTDFFRNKISEIQGFVSSITPDFLKFGDEASDGIKKAEDATKESSRSILETIGDLIKKYRDAGKEWITSDEEVTTKLEENKEKRVKSQKDETDRTVKETKKREGAVIKIIDESNKKREAIESKRLKNQAALNAAEIALLKAQQEGASANEIKILKEKYEKIKEINELSNDIIELESKEHLSVIEQLQLDHFENILKLKTDFIKKDEDSLRDTLRKIRAGEKTREQIQREGIIEREKARVREHNQRIKDEIELGKRMAMIKSIQRQTEYTATKTAANELAQLINSENDNLKTIGKAATIVQIGISTAESAIKAFNGLAWIPVVGIGLGILAAAAVTAYGAEQMNNVRKMQDGGIVPGSGRGDKIPALLEPGELVVPRDITMELMEKLGARKMADGGRATGDKEKKDLNQTFNDIFNPSKFIKALVYEYLGIEHEGDGVNQPSGFGAAIFGEMIGGMIRKAEGSVKELADLVLDQLPGGKYLQKMMKWSRLPEERLKEIIADIVGEGPIFQFLSSIDDKLTETLFSGITQVGGDIGSLLGGIGEGLGGILGGIGGGLGFQNGGIVPGTGNGDIVPAFLEPGELVVPKDLTSDLLNISSGFGNIQIPTSNQDTVGGIDDEKRIVVELNMNDNAAEVINAQIREGDNLGYLNRN